MVVFYRESIFFKAQQTSPERLTVNYEQRQEFIYNKKFFQVLQS